MDEENEEIKLTEEITLTTRKVDHAKGTESHFQVEVTRCDHRSFDEKQSKTWSLDAWVESEKSFFIDFLKERGCPYDIKARYPTTEGGEKRKLIRYAKQEYVDPVDPKHNGALEAILGLYEIHFSIKAYERNDVKMALVHSFRSSHLAKVVLQIALEAKVYAGSHRTSEAATERKTQKAERVALARPIFTKYVDQGKTKADAGFHTARRLKEGFGIEISDKTISQDWFRGKNWRNS